MCDYCQKDKDIISEYDMNLCILESFDGFYHFMVNGSISNKRVNYCPMCGRKLTSFEVNL